MNPNAEGVHTAQARDQHTRVTCGTDVRASGGRQLSDGLQPTTEPRHAASPGEDLSRALADPATAWPDVVLRDHQLEALDELSGRLTHGATRTWVDAPTGSGKTIMFLALAQALGGSTLVLVPRRNLAD